MCWLAVLGLLTTHAAIADDGREGLFVPGATPVAAGGGHVGLFAGAYAAPFNESGTGGGGQFALGLTNRVALIGTIGLQRRTSVGGSGGESGDRWVGMVALRGSVIERDNIRFSVLLTHVAEPWRPYLGSIGPGFALEGGGAKVRFDLSVPSVAGVRAVVRDGDYGLEPAYMLPGGLEAGVTFAAGKTNAIRVGIPAVTWMIRGENLYVDLSASLLLLFNGVSMSAGARF